MNEKECKKGVNAFGNLSCGVISDDCNFFLCSNEVRQILFLLASIMGSASTSLNQIRLNAIQMLKDANEGTALARALNATYMFNAKSFVCIECSALMSKAKNTIETLGCSTKEREIFESVRKEGADIFFRLEELTECKIITEDLLSEGLMLTKLTMLCHAIWANSLRQVDRRRGICALREESTNGLWLTVICTFIGIARSRLRELRAETKPLKQSKDVHVLVNRFLGVVDDLIVDVEVTETLMKVIGKGMTPATPVALEQLTLFHARVSSVAAFLGKEWRGLAQCEDDQQGPLQNWMAEEDANLSMISPHPAPAPCVGYWYTYADVNSV